MQSASLAVDGRQLVSGVWGEANSRTPHPGSGAQTVLPIGGAEDDLSGLLGREDVGVDHKVVIGGRLRID